MIVLHKAFAAALFCGAVGFAHSGYAAQPANTAAATITENGAPQPNGGIKRTAVPPPQGGSERAEQERTAELNKQSLQSSEFAATPAAEANEAPTGVLPAFGNGRQVAGAGGGGKGGGGARGGGGGKSGGHAKGGGGGKGSGGARGSNGGGKGKRGSL